MSLNRFSLPPVHVPAPVAGVLFHAVPLVVMMYGFWDEYADYLQSQSLNGYRGDVEEFDFIVVGGGSAGSVVANRLSENGHYSVLLLEAGGNPNPMQSVPVYFTTILHSPPVDYEFYTVPQRNACLALKDQRSFWPRGRGLGGSSNLNCMYFQRGHKNDYDKWAELSGDDEWRFDNVLRNFKNIEDYHGTFFNETYHSNNGKGVYLSTSNEKHLMSEFLEAGREMGYPTKDVNGIQEGSFSPLDLTIKNGHRQDAYTVFLKPVVDRKNLKIYRYARVVKVEFDEKLRAVGVTYIRHGVKRFVRSTKEIILSAGAIDSPKILMLSGVGVENDLVEIGIKPLVNLPVGLNLQDHVMSFLGPFIVDTPRKTFNLPRDLTVDTITRYFKDGTGVMSTPMITNAVGYVHSSLALSTSNSSNISSVTPDIQLVLAPISPAFYPLIEKMASFKKGFVSEYFGDSDKKDGFFVNVMLGKYKSRGVMKLASKNWKDKPVLDPRYFSHPDDIRVIVDGLNFTTTMVENTKVFQRIGARLIDKHVPGCEGFELRSMEYYECYARHWTLTVYHHSGTCTMGKGTQDRGAVVDSKLRLLHTKGLRVVDASIIPEIPNSNINAAVYMIADKGSEMILDEWRRRESG